MRGFGHQNKPTANLLPIPPAGSPDRKRLTLLTDSNLDSGHPSSHIDVLLCSVFPLLPGQSSTQFPTNLDLSGDTPGSTRLACKNAASDAVALPASTTESQQPFDQVQPFHYLEYEIDLLSEHQFLAVVDKRTSPTPGWLLAEFNSRSESTAHTKHGLQNLVSTGIELSLPPTRSMVIEIKIPSMHSSLLAYKLKVERKSHGSPSELFTPLLRQHISEPYESKFFVNIKEADISLHGVAPYMPPALKARENEQGVSLQFWSDPTCNKTMDISLQVDIMGSTGKLWMRYRTVFAAFPLLVVALVLRKQFQLYDQTGIFMSFSESMDQSLRRSVPALLIGLTFLAMSFSKASQTSQAQRIASLRSSATESAVDFTINDLLLGSQDPFFWFLVPLFGLISVGICIGANYAFLCITYLLSFLYTSSIRVLSKTPDTT